jgi:hypothetical protein
LTHIQDENLLYPMIDPVLAENRSHTLDTVQQLPQD